MYLEAVAELHEEHICIPFPWIKAQIGSELFLMDSPVNRPSSGADLAQLWKDMMRDKVCINGQVIYGESGPESILGALARSIVSLAMKSREHEPRSPSGTPLALQQSQPLYAMNEVQAVAYTMDVLLACNRTQSGGDTYYCVEYLFRNPSLVVLCPYSSHAEPLQIFLELVDEPVDQPIDPHPVLSDDEASVSTPGGQGGSFKERARKVQSVRLPTATRSPPPTIMRSNSLTKLTSLLPPDAPGAAGELHTFSRTLPPSSTRVRGGVEFESPIPSPASAGEASLSSGVDDDSPPTPSRPTRPVIRVKIQANTSYKICPADPQDNNEDIWR
jgi:hypothetical protein